MNYEEILNELKTAGVAEQFQTRLKAIAGGTVFNQRMFDLLYSTYKLNPKMFD